MGRVKEEWMRQLELEPMYEWIEENYGYEIDEEGSDEWEEALEAYEEHCEERRNQEIEDELEWYIYTQSEIGKFDTQIKSVLELLEINVTYDTEFSLFVMLHGHLVAAVESYLASTFIHKVTNSEELIKRLIETDPIFSKKKFTLKEIYKEHEKLKLTVASYLKDLIFHDVAKVKPMFKEVLDCDFGDITWLFHAVNIRHDCVHRAGLDKQGNRVDISKESIEILANQSTELVHSIEDSIVNLELEDDVYDF